MEFECEFLYPDVDVKKQVKELSESDDWGGETFESPSALQAAEQYIEENVVDEGNHVVAVREFGKKKIQLVYVESMISVDAYAQFYKAPRKKSKNGKRKT